MDKKSIKWIKSFVFIFMCFAIGSLKVYSGELGRNSKYSLKYTTKSKVGTIFRYATDHTTSQSSDPDNILQSNGLTNQPILITGIFIQARNLPKKKMTADHCLFVQTLGVDPGPTELGCKFAAINNRGSFYSAVNYPVGVFLPANSFMGCALAINSINHKWSTSELSRALISCRITFTPYKPGMAYGQILRIPYLDSVKEGPNLISQGAWYSSSASKPISIKGIQYFYGLFGQNVEAQACLIRKNKKGAIVGKNCAPKVIRNQDNDIYDPPTFTPLNVVLSEGTIHAECKSSSKSDGDCAIYILVERDGSTAAPKSASTLYYKHQNTNTSFVHNHFCKFHLNEGHNKKSNPKYGRITPAGVLVLDEFIRKTTFAPWANMPSRSREEACKLMTAGDLF